MKKIISVVIIAVVFVGIAIGLASCGHTTPPANFDAKILQGHGVDRQEYQDNLSLAKIVVD